MNTKNIFTILGKELTVFLRDKRTLITTFIVPLVFYYVFFNIMTGMALKTKKEIKNKKVKVGFSQSIENDLIAYISKNGENISLLQTKVTDAEKLLADKKIDAYLFKEEGKIVIEYNSAKRLSIEARKRLKNALDDYKKFIVNKNLTELGIDKKIVNPFEIEDKDTASQTDVAMAFIGRLMPYLIIIMLFSGALGFGLEVSTGEKEKGTIATLLVSQASRSEIVLGKLIYVIAIEIIYSIVNIAGFLLASLSTSKMVSKEIAKEAVKNADKMQSMSLSINLSTITMLVALIIPIGIISAALIIAIGSYAKSMKEGQTLMTPVLLAIIMVAILTLNAPLKVPEYYYFIPILNTAFSMQEILMGKAVFSHFLLAVTTTIGLAAILIGFSIYLFNREDIHFRV
ncbi:sodium transport system permease protein [Thermotomaculum hydrothermale]|uniref:Sodium transport system permease protein n=1 Tax=Thermotomaculum hydrothermale TaxID=981385 RepID=A0A7R6SYI1_9BACT|nr:ABC transporter permease [Thermotomaculum hydrothermale]BBB32581.1 sodium transport system permease protein [Thermotomaculum hydrothermale]